MLKVSQILLMGLTMSLAGLARADNHTRGTECHDTAPHLTIQVNADGRYANPEGVGGLLVQRENCRGYIVDFVSERKMLRFKPDADWLKVRNFPNGLGCKRTCSGEEYSPYRATVDVYKCSKRDCSQHLYQEKVGSYRSYYSTLKVIGTGQPVCRTIINQGELPVVKDAYGVRMVIRHDIIAYKSPDCEEKLVGSMPNWLGFNASGTASFGAYMPIGGKRPKAEAAQ